MLAKRADRAGRALERRGWKARATGVGRAKAALPKVRARPLWEKPSQRRVLNEKGKKDEMGRSAMRAYLLNMMKVEERGGRGQGFWMGGGKEGRRRKEVGGLFARELGGLSLSGAVLPMVP